MCMGKIYNGSWDRFPPSIFDDGKDLLPPCCEECESCDKCVEPCDTLNKLILDMQEPEWDGEEEEQ